MKNMLKTMVIAMLFCFMAISVFAEGEGDKDLESFIKSLDIEAQADMSGFKSMLSVQFDISLQEVEVLISKVDKPSDAYMCLRITQISKQPQSAVIKEYRASKGKGWGVIAINLGIKPGSKEFHSLKSKGDQKPGKSFKGKGHR